MNPFSKFSLFVKKHKGRFLVTLTLIIWGGILFNNFFREIKGIFDYFFVKSNRHLYLYGSCIIVYLLYYFIWIVPKNILEKTDKNFKTNYKEYHSAVKSYRTINAQIVGGIFFLLTVSLTFTQIQNDKKANDDKLLIEQYQKAIDQLNDGNIASRLGGIYTLEKIMNENEYYHWKIVEILCAYIREKRDIRKYDVELSKEDDHPNISIDDVTKSKMYEITIGFKKNGSGQDVPVKKSYFRVPVERDIQAILTILGRRNRKFEKDTLRNVDLEYLIRKNHNIHSSTPLIYFSKNDYTKNELFNINFPLQIIRDYYNYRINLSFVSLYKADLENAYLDISYCIGTHFVSANLNETSFSQAIMKNAHFENAYISSSFFANTYCSGAHFENAKCSSINFYGADLTNSSFMNADCCCLSFQETTLEKINLTNSLFTDIDFEYAKSITFEQLCEAKSLYNSHNLSSDIMNKLLGINRKIFDDPIRDCSRYNFYF